MHIVYKLGVGALSAFVTSGCLNRPIEDVEPRTTKFVVEALPLPIDRLDIVLAIDNSSSMGDKQKILGDAVPRLVDRLVNPSCVDGNGSAAPNQPASPKDDCPSGFKREFRPIADINVGIISSSLGDLNAGSCSGAAYPNDLGHLVRRSTGAGDVATYKGQGFLAWDLNSERAGETDPAAVKSGLKEMVLGSGQDGCGYEMQLESVTRFLVDPAPYASLDVIKNGAGVLDTNKKRGDIDQEVLAERAQFLRPDSLVAILLLTDENDCSMKPEGPGFNVIKSAGFYKASSACAANPDDACCYSCGQSAPAGCPTDASCVDPNGAPARYSTDDDTADLRCWDQKRRYGIDFLYPTARYVNAFTQEKIDPTRDDLSVVDASKAVPNPLFSNLDGEKVQTRGPDRVFFAGVVGVPWQAIARTTNGAPDIKKGFKSYDELLQDGLFAKLVGDPTHHVLPTDPFMVESTEPRAPQSDVLNTSPSQVNDINGGDIATANKHLEYACVFDLDCGSSCASKYCDANPDLCVNNLQTRAKGYPGLRELSVLQGMQEQGIVASVCPANLADPTDIGSYGYNPAVNAIVDQLKVKLNAQCLPTQLHANDQGQVACIAIEARTLQPNETCSCDGPARSQVGPDRKQAIVEIQKDPSSEKSWDCFCEIDQVTDKAALASCQTVGDDLIAQSQVDGWCYLDADTAPPIGDPTLLANCPTDEKHAVRFVNKGEPVRGARAIITCSSE